MDAKSEGKRNFSVFLFIKYLFNISLYSRENSRLRLMCGRLDAHYKVMAQKINKGKH